MKICSLLLLSLVSVISTGQSQEQEISVDSIDHSGKVYLVVEMSPKFEGGNEAMHKFIEQNMVYPKSAKRMQIEGTVFVGFIINVDGSVTDASVIKGISKECDAEAIRVILSMPKWRPGIQNGKIVRTKFVDTVKFKLD